MAKQTETYEIPSALEKGTIGGKLAFDDINQPGAYISNWDGYLLRVSDVSLKPGSLSPLMDIVGKKPLYVTKISNNPYIELSKARQVAANLDYEVNF